MAELTHDTTEDGFHEIQLSGKQLVFLFMLTTGVLVLVFLLGVQVGRDVRAERGEDSIDAAPAATTASSQPTSGAAEPPAPRPKRISKPRATPLSEAEKPALLKKPRTPKTPKP